MWESGVSFQSTCVLATAATSRANPGWSGKDETVQGKEESGKEGKMRESEKKASRGSSDALRLPRPKKEIAIAESEILVLRRNSLYLWVEMAMERGAVGVCVSVGVCARRLRLFVCRRLDMAMARGYIY